MRVLIWVHSQMDCLLASHEDSYATKQRGITSNLEALVSLQNSPSRFCGLQENVG